MYPRASGPGFMKIVGEWHLCDDGITRPTVRVQVAGSVGTLSSEDFLVDTCADRTAFSAALLSQLQGNGRALPSDPPGHRRKHSHR